MTTHDVVVERLLLATVTFPDWHPRYADGGCSVYGYAVRHPDGVILFDTGVGNDNDFIADLYHPTSTPITVALAAIGIDERDVVAVVNSHLHFDHCGQNALFHGNGVPIYAQAAEIVAAHRFGYTVPEWAAIPDHAMRRVHGDETLAAGVTIIETPGHSPGHQSLVVETASGRVVVAGQCVYSIDEVSQCCVAIDNMHDDTCLEAGQDSLNRILALTPHQIVAAHDLRSWPSSRPTV